MEYLNKFSVFQVTGEAINEARQQALTYHEKKAGKKGEEVVDGVVVFLKDVAGKQKEVADIIKKAAINFNKLEEKYKKIKNVMATNENTIRANMDLLFDETDELLTRQANFDDLVVQIGKMSVTKQSEIIRYDKVIEAFMEIFAKNKKVMDVMDELLKNPEYKEIVSGGVTKKGQLNTNANAMSKTYPVNTDDKKELEALKEGAVTDVLKSAIAKFKQKIKEYIGVFRDAKKSYDNLEKLVVSYSK